MQDRTLTTFVGNHEVSKGPRSHKIGGRVFWLKSDCDQWLTAQLTSTARGGVR